MVSCSTMGNVSDKSAVEKTRSHQTDLLADQLQLTLQKWLMEGKDTISVDTFKDAFQLVPTYGELLFHFMCAASGQTAGSSLARQTFVSVAKSMVQLPCGFPRYECYFRIFTHNKQLLHADDCVYILRTCYMLIKHALNLKDDCSAEQDDNCWRCVADSLCGSTGSIDCASFSSWCGVHCAQLLEPIHAYTCDVLCEAKQPEQRSPVGVSGECLQRACVSGSLLPLPLFWLLSASLTPPFISTSGVTSPSSGSSSLLAHWQLLYSSEDNGLSANRFKHHVLNYKGATLTLIQFDPYLFSFAVDIEWRETNQRWGNDCYLHELRPNYRRCHAGSNMVYFNIGDRRAIKGLYMGEDKKTPLLQVDADFSQVTHNGIQLPLQRIEVWGCADVRALHEQKQQKVWEQKDTEKHKNKKLTLDDWRESADQSLLKMAGIETDHSQR